MKKNLFICVFVATILNAQNTEYINNNELQLMLKKIETASKNESHIDEKAQKAEELQKDINIASQQKTLNDINNSTGLNKESVDKRIKSLQKYFDETEDLNEFIFTNDFSYQLICKTKANCKASAFVDADIFNYKLQVINEKISSSKKSLAKALEGITPVEEKVNILRNIEQNSYSTSDFNNTSNISVSTITTDDSKKKKYLKVIDGQKLGKVLVTITKEHIKLSRI